MMQLKKLSSFFPLKSRLFINKVFQKFMPIGARGRKTIELFSTDFINSNANINEFFSKDEQEEFFFLSNLTNKPNRYETPIDKS